MPNTYNFLDENGLLYYSLLIKTELDKKLESPDLTTVENKIPSTITITPNPNNVSLALTSTNGTGTATIFPIVDTTNVGAMSPSMLTKLNTLPSNIIDGTNIALYQMTVGNIYSKDGKIYIPKTNGGRLGSFDVIEISKDGIYEKSYNSNSGNSSSVEIYDKNIIEQILLAGTTVTPTNKTVNIPLATESQDGLISKDNVTRLNKTLVNDKTYIGLPWNNANVNPATLFNLDSQAVAAKTGFYIPINYVNETSTLFLLESPNEFLSSTGKYYGLIPQYNASYGSYPFMFITSDSRLFFITKESSTTVILFYLSYNSLKYRLGGNGVWESWDDYFSIKANLSSPTFKGTPKAPTPASGTNNTQIATTAFVQSAIAAAVTGSFKFVNTLPVTGEEGYIYLVPHTHTSGTTSSNPDVKDEYIWNTSTSPALWELIGNTDLDLSTHWSKSELTAATNNEILAVWNSVWTTNELENNG